MAQPFIHPTAVIEENVQVGADTRVWMNVQIRPDVRIGTNCNIGRNAYIENGARIGNNCKIHNNTMLFSTVELEEGVFIGPGAILTNDKTPRAVNVDGTYKDADDWHAGHIHIARGASVGAGAIVVTDLTIGAWAMIAAGAVVTKNVPAHALVVGVPARIVGYVCKCGERLIAHGQNGNRIWACTRDSLQYHMGAQGSLYEIENP